MEDSIARLKFIRKKMKITQKKLAISIGLKRDHITSLESGKVKFSILHALALEHVHGINKDWLLYGSGDYFVKKQNTEEAPLHLFLDQPRADRIIQNLATLERTDPAKYNKVEGYIDAQIDNPPQKNAGAETRDAIKKTGT